MKKRLGSLLLALVLCLSLLPVSAQAAEAVGPSTRFYRIERSYQIHNKHYNAEEPGLRPGNLMTLKEETDILGIHVWQSDETLTELSVSLVNTETEKVYGPWAAEKSTDSYSQDSWYAFPGAVLPAGTYRIVNSQSDTWRVSDAENNAAEIKGCPADLWIAHADASYAGGTGTEADPYQIATAAQLAKLAKDAHDAHVYDIEESVHYKLMADIDLDGYLWVPIGSEDDAFYGWFDGNHHIVRNMKIQASRCPWVERYGLFGRVYRADSSEPSIQRLYVEHAEILVDITGVEQGHYDSDFHYIDAGLLVGTLDGGNVVKDCMTSGKITVAKGMDVRGIGGVVGAQTIVNNNDRPKNYVENCAFIGTIEDLSGLNALKGCGVGGISGYQGERSDDHMRYSTLSVRGGYAAADVVTGTADFSGTGTYTNMKSTHYTSYYNSELSTPAKPNADIIGKTTAEMKAPAFAAELGDGWKQDASLNGGYPYLAGFETALGASADYLLDGTMEITGNQSIGSTLTAEVTGCSESDLTYNWYHFGRAEVIDTGNTHVLTREDMGRTLYCRAVSGNGSYVGAIRGEAALSIVDHGREGYHVGALQESFDGGTMPEGWSTAAANAWKPETEEGKNHHGSGHISCTSWDVDGGGNLYTPTFKVGLGDVLTFCAVGQNDARPFEHLIVYVKTAEGSRWSQLASITTTSQWEEYSVEFPKAWAGENVQVRFFLNDRPDQGKINLDCVYHWVPDVRPLEPGPAAPTGFTPKACSNYLNNDGTIEFNSSYRGVVEYRKAGNDAAPYTLLAADHPYPYQLTGLTPGVYKFRYAETATQHASAVTNVTVPEAVKYTVSFYGNHKDVTGEGPASMQLAVGATCTVPENTFTRTGYTFTHWLDTTGWDDIKRNPGDTFIMTQNSVYMRAQWKENQYTVRYDANGGTGTMADQTLLYTKTAALTKNQFSRSGYDFSGWNTKADGSGTAYPDGQRISGLSAENNATVTLYAQWTPRGTVAAPSFTPADGTTFKTSLNVSLSTATAGASVYYTLDGSDPGDSSNAGRKLYSAPIELTETATVKAIAVKDGMTDSAVVQAAFTKLAPPAQVETPVIRPGSGSFEESLTVSITCGTEGADIYYTTDGSAPSADGGSLYKAPFVVKETTVVKAIGVKADLVSSNVASARFDLTEKPVAPVYPTEDDEPDTYPVTPPRQTEHGEVTVRPRNAEPEERVTVTVKPDPGYRVEDVIVTDRRGNRVPVKDMGDHKYSFEMPVGRVDVSARFSPVQAARPVFTDVPADAYFYRPVYWAVDNRITSGVTDTLFMPQNPCTRAQMVTFLWRFAGAPAPETAANPFTDVEAGSYYEEAVLWAAEKGITGGVTETTFAPDAPCTRAQAVVFLHRYEGGESARNAGSFTDVAADAYYGEAVSWAVEQGVTTGTTAVTFTPDAICTRAQIVTFLYRSAMQ